MVSVTELSPVGNMIASVPEALATGRRCGRNGPLATRFLQITAAPAEAGADSPQN